MKVKALTIKQPWAWAIAAGHKRVENRGWETRYRGPLAIHAGKAWDLPGARWIRAHPLLLDVAEPPGMDDVPRGAVVAVAELTAVCRASVRSPGRSNCGCGPWSAAGQFHWRLSNVITLPEPFPCPGKQGLWEVDLPDFPIGGAR